MAGSDGYEEVDGGVEATGVASREGGHGGGGGVNADSWGMKKKRKKKDMMGILTTFQQLTMAEPNEANDCDKQGMKVEIE